MTEDVDRGDWDGPELLEAFADALCSELHTALPGRVESYDASAQVADVTPQLRRALSTDSGETVHETLPTLRRVRVMQPRAHQGGWHIHCPLAPGDFVLLVVLERDPTRWITTGELSPTPDTRTHHLAHAIAIPGLYPHAQRLTNPPTNAMVIGREGGARIELRTDGTVVIFGDAIKLGSDGVAKHVALAEDVESALATMRTEFFAHVHPIPAPVSGNSSAPTNAMSDPGGLGSSVVELD